MSSQDPFTALFERLEEDGELAGALEVDAFATLRELGFEELVETLEQERDRIGTLVDRIYADESFREAVEHDPLGELGEWGIPEYAIAPVLVLAGAPDEVVEQATADVEAHLLGKKPASVAAMAAILGTLAFAQQANAAQPQVTTQVSPAAQAQVTPSAEAQVAPATTAQVSPAAAAQVSPAAQPQVEPAVTAQVSPAAKAQVAKAQQKRWQGIQTNRVAAQARLLALLRAQGTVR